MDASAPVIGTKTKGSGSDWLGFESPNVGTGDCSTIVVCTIIATVRWIAEMIALVTGRKSDFEDVPNLVGVASKVCVQNGA